MGNCITCLRDKVNSEFACSLGSSGKFTSRMRVGLRNSVLQCVYFRHQMNEMLCICELRSVNTVFYETT